jgi:hypothetical protein
MPITLNSKVYGNVGFNQNSQFVYSEKSAGVPAGFSYLTAKAATGTGKSDSTVKWNLSLPIVAATDSDCTCAGDVLRGYYAKIEVTIPSGSTAAERDDVLKRIQSLVAAAQFTASINDLAQPST